MSTKNLTTLAELPPSSVTIPKSFTRASLDLAPYTTGHRVSISRVGTRKLQDDNPTLILETQGINKSYFVLNKPNTIGHNPAAREESGSFISYIRQTNGTVDHYVKNVVTSQYTCTENGEHGVAFTLEVETDNGVITTWPELCRGNYRYSEEMPVETDGIAASTFTYEIGHGGFVMCPIQNPAIQVQAAEYSGWMKPFKDRGTFLVRDPSGDGQTSYLHLGGKLPEPTKDMKDHSYTLIEPSTDSDTWILKTGFGISSVAESPSSPNAYGLSDPGNSIDIAGYTVAKGNFYVPAADDIQDTSHILLWDGTTYTLLRCGAASVADTAIGNASPIDSDPDWVEVHVPHNEPTGEEPGYVLA